ncbi:MAG: hypothetical protein ACYSR9_00190 [Planctomycetota bacterium]|jgi:hypothetical protein
MYLTAKSRDKKKVSIVEQEKERVPAFPHLVFLELLATLAVMIFFILISIYFNAPLEEIASPSDTPNPAKAPWYFVGLQELLVYFDPWIGGVVIPLLILLGLMASPFLSMSRRKEQVNRSRYQQLGVLIFTAGLVLWFILIIIGQYFRGPSWLLYWPWESWDVHKETQENLWNFSLPLGVSIMTAYFSLALIAPALKWRDFYRQLGLMRYSIFMIFMALFVGVFLKIILRLVFGVKYILTTPWFNI